MGWWEQLRTNKFKDTQKSYGQDIYALDPRLLKREQKAGKEPTPAPQPKEPEEDSSEESAELDGQQPEAPATPNTDRVKSSGNVVYLLVCTNCGHERQVTRDFIMNCRRYFGDRLSFLNMEPLRENLGRLKCVQCEAKAPSLIQRTL